MVKVKWTKLCQVCQSRPSQPLSPQFWKIWRADTLQITSRCQAKSLSTNRAQRGRAIGSCGQNHNQLYTIALAEGSVSKKCFWWTDKIAEAWIHVTSWCWWPASFSCAVYIYVFVNPEMCKHESSNKGVKLYALPCSDSAREKELHKSHTFRKCRKSAFYVFLPALLVQYSSIVCWCWPGGRGEWSLRCESWCHLHHRNLAFSQQISITWADLHAHFLLRRRHVVDWLKR